MSGTKFIRGMVYPSANSGARGVAWRMKWMYEFWGFCVNGGASLTVPGGFATNGNNMPTNFTAGTSLMASGSDGYYPAIVSNLYSGDLIFSTASSSPFTPAMVGKALVIWQANSGSSEDSIYVISQYINNSQVLININTGGTPDPTTKHPSMTNRSGINYRVVDMETGAASIQSNTYTGAYLVLQTNASLINAGQANSQIQFTQGWSNSGISAASWWIGLSGTGSWNGNIAGTNITNVSNTSPMVVTTATAHGLSSGQTVTIGGVLGNYNANGNYVITVTGANTFSLNGSTTYAAYTSGGTVWNGFANDGYSSVFYYDVTSGGGSTGEGQTAITMIADQTFYICHIKEQVISGVNNYQANFHFEVPTRLYPQNQDLHPITIMIQTSGIAGLTTSSTTSSYGGGFLMRTHTSDATTVRYYRTLVKALRGDGTPDVFGSNLSDYRLGYNTISGTIPMSDAILCLPGVTNQYSLARVRLRTVKFTGTHVPVNHRLGANGEWIQMQNGICWPWDNTIIPVILLYFGAN